ncbi:MAG: hypothetical protein KIT84_11265 [Labilithrix sp.]|nr:hypothetical protein [Labilithrix sp.]MCW5811588.1 hypothetical protein [Labilithrix sp.]
MRSKRIEILFFAGCPHIELATARAREAIEASNVSADIALLEVTDSADAIARRFLGSPSVRVDGTDVDPSAWERSDFGLQCRVYSTGERLDGAPPSAWIAAALQDRVAVAPQPSAPQHHGCCAASAAPPAPRLSTHLRSILDALVEPLLNVFPLETAPVMVALFRQLARGAPVAHAELALSTGGTVGEIDDALAKVPVLDYVDGRIVGAALTLRETPYAFEVEGRRLYTWCALDALFLPVILGRRCRVSSSCPATGQSVRLDVSPDGVVEAAPATAALSAPLAASPDDLRASFCRYARFFTSPAAVERWAPGDDAGSLAVVDVHEAFQLAKAVASALRWA